MKKKTNKKLQLNKETIAGLNSKKLNTIKGGGRTMTLGVTCDCDTRTCESIDVFCTKQ